MVYVINSENGNIGEIEIGKSKAFKYYLCPIALF